MIRNDTLHKRVLKNLKVWRWQLSIFATQVFVVYAYSSAAAVTIDGHEGCSHDIYRVIDILFFQVFYDFKRHHVCIEVWHCPMSVVNSFYFVMNHFWSFWRTSLGRGLSDNIIFFGLSKSFWTSWPRYVHWVPVWQCHLTFLKFPVCSSWLWYTSCTASHCRVGFLCLEVGE